MVRGIARCWSILALMLRSCVKKGIKVVRWLKIALPKEGENLGSLPKHIDFVEQPVALKKIKGFRTLIGVFTGFFLRFVDCGFDGI